MQHRPQGRTLLLMYFLCVGLFMVIIQSKRMMYSPERFWEGPGVRDGAQATPSVVSGAQATPSVVSGAQATPSVVSGAQATPSVVSGAQATPAVVSGERARVRDAVGGGESFYGLAKSIGTDKVGPRHTYYHAYERYLAPLRHLPIKMMEIGLGCNMGYGPGKSVKVWTEFFQHPEADLWEAEYDAACVEKWGSRVGGLLKNPVLVGDQADVRVLQNWTLASGGHFDVIVEDGGHSNLQMLHSFAYLFHHALKPGGIYFMEDMGASHPQMQSSKRFAYYRDGPDTPMSKVLQWVQALVLMDFPIAPGVSEEIRGVQSIHCFKGMCAFHKCPEGLPSGQRCP